MGSTSVDTIKHRSKKFEGAIIPAPKKNRFLFPSYTLNNTAGPLFVQNVHFLRNSLYVFYGGSNIPEQWAEFIEKHYVNLYKGLESYIKWFWCLQGF